MKWGELDSSGTNGPKQHKGPFLPEGQNMPRLKITRFLKKYEKGNDARKDLGLNM